MQGNTDLVVQELKRILPLSIMDDIACFVFYDNHPRDLRSIDIAICTKNGELREYYQRDLSASIHLTVSSEPSEIIILRNSASELFYIVGTKDEVHIVSFNKSLHLHRKITNVERFAVDDRGCNGQTCLKVIRKDDAVPIFFDENFKSSEAMFPSRSSPDYLPIYSELKRKYTEAKYSVKNHEKSIREYIKLRHAATLCAYQNIHPNHGDSLFRCNSSVYRALRVKTQKPWVKVCNTKIVVALHVLNEYKEPIENVHILLNSPTITSLSYITKTFTNTDILPFWREHTHSLSPNCEMTVVAVMEQNDIRPSVTDKMVLNGALSYNTGGKTFLMPFEEIMIPSKDMFSDAFDALSSDKYDANTMLAILSTTKKTDLKMRLITHGESLIDLFSKHLHMERISPDIVLYNKSPYHVLNGAMLHFIGGTDKSSLVTAYTRNKSQLLALIHSVNDSVPAKIIVTTPNFTISTNVPELSEFSEPIPESPKADHIGYAKTVLKRTERILEYLDVSMVKMSESKDPNVIRQVGFQIDLYGCGKNGYKEFRDQMLREEKKGVECLMKEASGVEPMVFD